MGDETRGTGLLATLTPAMASSRDLRDDAAVECAAALFLDRGIAGVKMTDIADACELGVATLYRHFTTKTSIEIAAATLLWSRFHERFRLLVETREFLELTGLDRLHRLLDEYCLAYREHPDFVKFLDEFDHAVLDERIEQSQLVDYGNEVTSFYVIFEDAYLLGLEDGSIARQVDFPVFYQAIAHALVGVAEKLMRGEIIPQDDFSRGDEELACIVDMAVHSLGQTSN